MSPESSVSTGRNLQTSYDEQYTDQVTPWRELGGKYKAQNLLEVCQGLSFTRVLDCGAGEGSLLKFVDASPQVAELYALEISDSGIAQIKKRSLTKLKEVKKFDGYVIPYPDRYFDLAYCSHVIEHVEHPRLLLRELKRVSRFQSFEVPLDYACDVDHNIQHFLAYGHINVFTPSLFRFLLKSEGFEVLGQKLSHTADEVVLYNWYENMKRRRSRLTEFKLKLRPWANLIRRWVYGARRFDEYRYSAYTCLTQPSGDLKIMS